MKKFIPDCFWPTVDNGEYVSHEAVCVLNPSKETAVLDITVYFLDKEPMRGFQAVCEGERTGRIRLDQIKNADGIGMPRGEAYALMIESNVDVYLQYTRVDTTQAELAISTTMI